LPGIAGGAELGDELAERGVGVAEALGHVVLAAAVGEDGTQRLVLPLGRARRLAEEAAIRGIVHRQTPGVR
jgi:hypothetical protein